MICHSCFGNVLKVIVGAGSLKKVFFFNLLNMERPFFDSISKMYWFVNSAPSHS